MNSFALIAGDVVVNVEVWDSPPSSDPSPGYTRVAIPASSRAGIGWRYEAGAFVAPAEVSSVPAEVWTYQAKTVMALTSLESLGLSGAALGLAEGASLYDAVLAGIASLPEPTRTAATIQLESAPGTRRDAPILAALSEALGLTPEMIDQLFIQAAAIP